MKHARENGSIMSVLASQKHLKAAGIARIVSKNYKRNEIHNSTKKKGSSLSLLLKVFGHIQQERDN